MFQTRAFLTGTGQIVDQSGSSLNSKFYKNVSEEMYMQKTVGVRLSHNSSLGLQKICAYNLKAHVGQLGLTNY